MSMLFRRPSSVSCFFCLSFVGPTSSVHNFDPAFFRCPTCGCLNRYDKNGRIINDEPAMYNERLNSVSFSKRGLPNPSHSLAMETTNSNIFCRTCQTNQMLLMNLRAAYLPAPDDPVYSNRLQNLPEYMSSLQTRYPPVCSECQPAVDEEIKRKNEFARIKALGGALKGGRPPVRREIPNKTLWRRHLWKMRGFLWLANTFLMLTVYLSCIFEVKLSSYTSIKYALPLFELVSLLWAFWDPTYSLQLNSRLQGRPIQVKGRQTYIVLQGIRLIVHLSSSLLLCYSWIYPEWIYLDGPISAAPLLGINMTRKVVLFLVFLCLELLLLILSYFSISIHKPASIRLIDSSAHRGLNSFNNHATIPSSSEKENSLRREEQWDRDIFSAFSITPEPNVTSTAINPMFGKPSLLQRIENIENNNTGQNGTIQNETQFDREYIDDDMNGIPAAMRRDPDAMDWEPATPYKNVSRTQNRGSGDGVRLHPQRFFPPEEPTGLEHLLMRTRLLDEGEGKGANANNSQNGYYNKWKWGWVYSMSVVPVAALLAGLWLRS